MEQNTFGLSDAARFGGLVFGLIIVNALKAKGYESGRQKALSVGIASLVAGALLFVIYCGLCYLGATGSTYYPVETEKGALVTHLVGRLFGSASTILLAIIVTVACMATSVALIGTTGTFISRFSKGRLNYKSIVVGTGHFSLVLRRAASESLSGYGPPMLQSEGS